MKRANKARNKSRNPSVPRPDPLQLAILAAILHPNFAPKAGLQKAMEFYLEAALFVEELPANFDDLLTVFGTNERKDDRLRKEADQTSACQYVCGEP